MTLLRKTGLKSSLAITTIVGCKNSCSYCPQGIFIKSYQNLSDQKKLTINQFEKCLHSVPSDICLSFSGFSEPWLNPECSEMIMYAFKKGHPIRVNTTLIGLKTYDIDKIKDIPFIKFVVHLPDDKNLTRINVDLKYLETIEYLILSRIKNLTFKFHFSQPDIAIHSDVNQILIRNKIKPVFTGINNRAGNVETNRPYYTANRYKVLRECQDFHHNILLPNGDVVLCHMDWSLKHILGNLTETNYRELYQREVFNNILSALKDTKSDILCRSCEKDIVERSFLQQIIFVFKKRWSSNKDIY